MQSRNYKEKTNPGVGKKMATTWEPGPGLRGEGLSVSTGNLKGPRDSPTLREVTPSLPAVVPHLAST